MLSGTCVSTVAIAGELSPVALAAVVGAGLVVSGVTLARRAGEAAPPVGRRGLPWLGWLAAAVAWETATLAHGGLPALSDLADPVLAHPLARAAATACWLAAGAWIATRPRSPRRPG
ncbi:hypothetical protein SAMN06893097_11141 [Geodermatophilus sabuli]|uniref:Uncharacterized protein n=1 Tax=Geodermatophilus sabuli TaxID=1564158 RepID=A0A285EHQ3_9ACTN|nr:hypothetical protein SAMN06893097_11141 [Geodermatophilus sabuli]